jgi:hypothetical protein
MEIDRDNNDDVGGSKVGSQVSLYDGATKVLSEKKKDSKPISIVNGCRYEGEYF